jgi:hypothetical protein
MGFKITQEFPSRFLKGTEIAGKQSNVIISGVKKEKVRSRTTNKEEPVLVVYFKDHDRGVVLKKERANDIVSVLGSDDTDGWIGQSVCIFTEKKNAFGGIQDCIRFKEAIPVQP